MKSMCGILAVCVVVAAAAHAAPPRKEIVLHEFQGGADGNSPDGGLVADENGNLYGVTSAGLSGAIGTAFELVRPSPGHVVWNKLVLSTFTPSDSTPYTAMVMDSEGDLFGTTVGTVFELIHPSASNPKWTKIDIFKFDGGSEGYETNGVIADKQGNLYGTTAFRGDETCGCGTVYKLSPQVNARYWKFTVLHTFKGGEDGRTPYSNVSIDASGRLFGVTTYGGGNYCAYGCGMVYRLDPPAPGGSTWNETVLYRFKGGNDGTEPWGGVTLDKSGAIYGSTSQGGIPGCGQTFGCGTVFKLDPPGPGKTEWTKSVLLRFHGEGDGDAPLRPLALDRDGSLWVPTSSGGLLSRCLHQGCGTLLKLTPPPSGRHEWGEQIIHQFIGGSDGAFPDGVLISHPLGAVVGTAGEGGATACQYGCGVVFDFRLHPQ